MDGVPSRKYGGAGYGNNNNKVTYGKTVKTHLSRSGWLGRALWSGEVEEREEEARLVKERKEKKEKRERKERKDKDKEKYKEKKDKAEKKKGEGVMVDVVDIVDVTTERDILEAVEKLQIGETELEQEGKKRDDLVVVVEECIVESGTREIPTKGLTMLEIPASPGRRKNAVDMELLESIAVDHSLSPVLPERRGGLRRRSSRLSDVGVIATPQGKSREGTPVEGVGTNEGTRVGASTPLGSLRDKVGEVTEDGFSIIDILPMGTPSNRNSPLRTDTPLTIPDDSGISIEKEEEEEKEDSLGKLLRLCTITEPVDFKNQIATMQKFATIEKLGEASYSEVFLQRPLDGTKSSSVIKIIPFGKPNQCTSQQILEEVRITKTMGTIKGFIGFHGTYVVRGRFPEALLDLWDYWDNEVKESENESPRFYEEDQLFAMIVLENGGTDLENFELKSWKEAWWVFWSVAWSLSRGELEREFEHRDLHFGNIVIRRKEKSKGKVESRNSKDPEEMMRKLRINDEGKDDPIGSEYEPELEVALIDYTLSRAKCLPDGKLSFMPLDDEALFIGKGDYQFDIYRFMKKLFSNPNNPIDPSTGLETIDWSRYNPKTNIYWLHYLSNILLTKKGLARPATRGRNAGKDFSEEEKKKYADLERVYRLIDCRKKRTGNGASKEKGLKEIGSAEELVRWAVDEGILKEGALE